EREPRCDFASRPGAGEIRACWFAAPGRKLFRKDGSGRSAVTGTEATSGAENYRLQHRGGSSTAFHPDAWKTERRGRKLQSGAGGVVGDPRPVDQSGGRDGGGKVKDSRRA